MEFKLQFSGPGGAGKTVDLRQGGEVRIGRSRKMTVALSDPDQWLSREHLIVTNGDFGPKVQIRGKNGATVDGAEARMGDTVEVQHGSRVEIGSWVLAFRANIPQEVAAVFGAPVPDDPSEPEAPTKPKARIRKFDDLFESDPPQVEESEDDLAALTFDTPEKPAKSSLFGWFSRKEPPVSEPFAAAAVPAGAPVGTAGEEELGDDLEDLLADDFDEEDFEDDADDLDEEEDDFEEEDEDPEDEDAPPEVPAADATPAEPVEEPEPALAPEPVEEPEPAAEPEPAIPPAAAAAPEPPAPPAPAEVTAAEPPPLKRPSAHSADVDRPAPAKAARNPAGAKPALARLRQDLGPSKNPQAAVPTPRPVARPPSEPKRQETPTRPRSAKAPTPEHAAAPEAQADRLTPIPPLGHLFFRAPRMLWTDSEDFADLHLAPRHPMTVALRQTLTVALRRLGVAKEEIPKAGLTMRVSAELTCDPRYAALTPLSRTQELDHDDTGRFSWRIRPVGPGYTLLSLVIAAEVDLDDGPLRLETEPLPHSIEIVNADRS